MYINPPDWDESLPEGYDTINGLVIADMEYSDGLSSWENPHYILNDWMTLENWERKNSFKKLVGANSEELHYNELYKHTAKIGNTSINDYTVVQSYGETETVPSYAKLGDYVAISDNSCSPYAPGYYVYKENEKSIYTLREAWENNFVDLEDIFNNTNILRLIGDTNNDKRVDIIDVTNIQKHLAKKEQLKNDMCVGNSDNADNLTVYFSDFDGNGITNIRDVSKIQKKLAKMI